MLALAQQTLLILLLVQPARADLSDSISSELMSRVDVHSNSLGDLSDASTDVDAPEQMDLQMTSAKPKALTPTELSLVQAKETHHVKGPKKKARKNLRHNKDVSLVKAWLARNQEVAEPDADGDAPAVEQLGGQLQNIMANIDDGEATPVVEKQQSNEQQESVMGDASNSDDSVATEKVAAKPRDVANADAENAVDGAMGYIRTKLAAEEHKGLRLSQLLAQSVRSNQKMKQRVEELRGQLNQGAKLQSSLRTATARKLSQELALAAKETKHAQLATGRLRNATKAAQIGEKAMKFLGMRLKYAKSQVAALLLHLANSSQTNMNLNRSFQTLNASEEKESKQLSESQKVEASQAKELADLKAKLYKLAVVEKSEGTKVATLSKQKDFLAYKQMQTGKREAILHKENNLLKAQLATEIQREEQLREMWTKESEAFTWQLRAERANASDSLSDLAKARAEFKDLRQRVQQLRVKAGEGVKEQHGAEEAAAKAQAALAEAEAENTQLKGSVPWLENEVNRQKQEVQNATTQEKQALKERDQVKNILGEAQKTIVQLQSQYADALQALVVAQAAGAEPKAQKPQVPTAADLDREGRTLAETVMDPVTGNQVAAPVDLSKDSGGLKNLLQDINNVR